MAQSDKFLKVQKRAEEVRQRYRDSQSPYANILVLGDSGAGKSALASTVPTPVFIDSFDPGGTKTDMLQSGISSGLIMADTHYEEDSWKSPYAFRDWERSMLERESEGFFDALGTYVLDSCTRWSDSLMFEIMRKNSRAGKNPQIQDYLVQQLTAVDWMGRIMAYGCNVLVTGHLAFEKDELTGSLESGPLMYGKLAKKIPIAFDECYIMRTKETSAGPKYQVLVHNDGYYHAKTRLGGQKFEAYEEPNIKNLMKKAGTASESYTDKENIFLT
jgi:hypothetical protein